VSVADALAELGDRHQVVVVTHLPQVAARAHQHVSVKKDVRKGITFASAHSLREDERAGEIARMLSGSMAVESAVEHARNMLKARARPRSTRR